MKKGLYDQLVKLHIFLRYGAFIGLIVICASLNAKVIDISLAELVKKSELIAYGHTTKPFLKEAESAVLFEPITVLKGKQIGKGQKIHLCKMPASSESYDLAAIEENYIVFAALDGHCYRPVHWISSIIKVKGDLAQTSAIVDQPDSQPLNNFLEKIRILTKGTTTK